MFKKYNSDRWSSIWSFLRRTLKGFASVEPVLFGKNQEYMDLSSIHVSEDMRGHGIGKQLFQLAAAWQNQMVRKNYIFLHILR